MLQKEIPGFGELFRSISYDEIGSPAMLQRATSGIIGNTAIFCLPGSPDAVTLAMEALIVPELQHICSCVRAVTRFLRAVISVV